MIFAEVFERAQQDGKLPVHVDVAHVANVAQSLVSEGARHWAAGVYGDRSFAEVVGRDITALIAGYERLGRRRRYVVTSAVHCGRGIGATPIAPITGLAHAEGHCDGSGHLRSRRCRHPLLTSAVLKTD